MRGKRPRRLVWVLLGALVAAAWFTWLRPVALGGDASYVIVQGHSMEPTYEDGDLVIVREASHYRQGDVIAFHAGGTFDDPARVIHRIVGDAGGGAFKTQGDNRDRTDPWEPTPDDVIGRAVLHIPEAGSAVGLLTRPEAFAAMGGAAVVVGGERRRRRRRPSRTAHRPPVEDGVTRPPASARPLPAGPSRLGRLTHPRWAFVGLVASLALALPVLALTWSSLRAPDSTQRVEVMGHVDYAIGLDYRFTGLPSPVYPTGEVGTTRSAAGAVAPSGPLYSRLLDRLDLELAFRVDGQGADPLTSTYAVDIAVETPGGWSTVLTSIPATPFEGTTVQTVPVDLRAVTAQVAAVADLTGVGGDEYTIAVTPKLEVGGSSEAGDVREQLGAPMTFEAKGNVITAKALEASERKDLTRTVSERATYSLGPWALGTQAARGLTGGLALVLVAGIAWFASVLFGGLGLGEPQRIAARYRSQIIDVAVATAPPGPVVMVSAIDELARIAKLEQTVMVHEDQGDGAHRYRVFLGTVTYEYETAPEHAGAAAAPEATDVGESGG